jgi:hypothetical protein
MLKYVLLGLVVFYSAWKIYKWAMEWADRYKVRRLPKPSSQ